VEIGIRTWWIGPRSEPRPIVVQIIPFVLAIVVALAATYNLRRLPWIAVAGSLGVGLIALFDVSRSGGLALVEAAIGLGALLVALASFTGRYRAGPSATASQGSRDATDGGTRSAAAPNAGSRAVPDGSGGGVGGGTAGPGGGVDGRTADSVDG
jgi:hypothetical protein